MSCFLFLIIISHLTLRFRIFSFVIPKHLAVKNDYNISTTLSDVVVGTSGLQSVHACQV